MNKKFVIYAKKNLIPVIKNIIKLEIIVTIQVNIEEQHIYICNLRYKTPKEIPVVFHNGSTYDYYFIIKELVKEFDGNFECLGENTEKYITFSVPIKKKIENKDLEITCKIKFIDSYRFMAMPLSKLIDNLSERIHNNKCANSKSCLDYIKTKNEKLILKCLNCEQYYNKKFNKE